jgi:DNA-binding MarR family transcriptional regulator
LLSVKSYQNKYVVIRYNFNMKTKEMSAAATRLQMLAEFRCQLRLFLHFSETAAQNVGLQPQHHQLLLQIAGARDKETVTIGYVAERLGLRPNTAVELTDRCEESGLVLRKQATSDRRRVLLELSPKGRQVLEALSIDHARELNELAPQLVRTLTALRAAHKKTQEPAVRRNK